MAVSVVASAAASTTLLAAGSHSKIIVENSDANRLYVLLDSGTASSANYSFSLATNESAQVAGYSGVVKGIWAADGSGNALVTTLG